MVLRCAMMAVFQAPPGAGGHGARTALSLVSGSCWSSAAAAAAAAAADGSDDKEQHTDCPGTPCSSLVVTALHSGGDDAGWCGPAPPRLRTGGMHHLAGLWWAHRVLKAMVPVVPSFGTHAAMFKGAEAPVPARR